ncbi:MAG: hypothetical protein R3C12_12535 [Planctomycetaceae bacterium]
MLYWIIGGGVALVGFSVVMLTVVIGFIGVTYFHKADDEATRTITQELRQEAEIDAAEKREIQLQQEREAWLSANFKSELATKIRENAPSGNRYSTINLRISTCNPCLPIGSMPRARFIPEYIQVASITAARF